MELVLGKCLGIAHSSDQEVFVSCLVDEGCLAVLIFFSKTSRVQRIHFFCQVLHGSEWRCSITRRWGQNLTDLSGAFAISLFSFLSTSKSSNTVFYFQLCNYGWSRWYICSEVSLVGYSISNGLKSQKLKSMQMKVDEGRGCLGVYARQEYSLFSEVCDW